MLTDKKVRALKPREASFDVLDSEGLFLRVRPNGRKVWFSRIKIDGQRVAGNLGDYPGMSLSDARAAHRQRIEARRAGGNPFESGEYTIRKLATAYLDGYAKKHKRSWAEDERNIKKDVLPVIGDMPVEDVTPRDIVLLCKGIEEGRESPRQARIVYSIIRKMFKYAIGQGLVQSSPCSELSQPGHGGTKKDRALSADEIRAIWEVVEERLDRSTARALRCILLTAQRPGEVRGMRYEEINGKWWTIPAERAKNGQAHRVYLTASALAEIGEGEGLVFPSPFLQGKQVVALSIYSLGQAVRRLLEWKDEDRYLLHTGDPKKPVPKFTPHDLRRTAATLCGLAGWRDEDIGILLNHSRQGVTAIYNRAAYDTERQKLAETVERAVLAALKGTAGKVTPIRRAK